MRFLLPLSLFLAAAGCSFQADEMSADSPLAIRDAYLMAHGMAQGYSRQPHADPKVLAELSRLDAQAFAAVRNMDNSYGNADASARAVAALTEYAAKQADGQP
jgi:hypothetical protein